MERSDSEWKLLLTPEQYRVLRECGTEPPFTGRLLYNKKTGVYVCAGCGNPLFASENKYDSGSGWPSFWASLPDSIETRTDTSYGMSRIEVRCKRCGSHLGHVFDDGPEPTGLRYCINSVALDFVERKEPIDTGH
ncbi:MAG: peptide-methionine (R)-S-oxide reductase MsrB [Candidatus Thorarchaeota archaeon]